MNSKHGLTQAQLDSPLYPETTDILIPFGPANDKYQELIAKHKNLGAQLAHDTRRLALALAQRIRLDGSTATDWELALMEQAGLGQAELPPHLTTLTGSD